MVDLEGLMGRSVVAFDDGQVVEHRAPIRTYQVT
jgi:hypothetical protein